MFASLNTRCAMIEHHIPRETAHKLARYALFSFIVTFALSRVFVFLIMSREMPNLYFFLRGTHVHHLNYGIFLMAAVCGYSVFRRPTGRKAEITALLYGVAMGLTFDEFGMWLHLGGSYWQRATGNLVAAAFVHDSWLARAKLRRCASWTLPAKTRGLNRCFARRRQRQLTFCEKKDSRR
jgi:hypothetical protein